MQAVVNDDAKQGKGDMMVVDGGDVPFVGVSDVAEDVFVQVEILRFGRIRMLRRGGNRGGKQQDGRQQEYLRYPTHTVTQLSRTSTKPAGHSISWLSPAWT